MASDVVSLAVLGLMAGGGLLLYKNGFFSKSTSQIDNTSALITAINSNNSALTNSMTNLIKSQQTNYQSSIDDLQKKLAAANESAAKSDSKNSLYSSIGSSVSSIVGSIADIWKSENTTSIELARIEAEKAKKKEEDEEEDDDDDDDDDG